MEKTLSDRELFNHIQKKVQAGYDVLGKDAAAACTYWLDAWKSVQQLFDQTKLKTVKEFDRRFKWSHFLSNWLQDLETELWNAGLDNRPLLQDRINFCENMLKRFPPAESPDLVSENLRRSLAETYFETGECEKAEQLFSAWLKDDPQWGWGWIGWSDLFQFFKNNKNLDKCEKILNEGLAIPEVRDHCDILERLSDVYYDLGRHDESDKLRTQSMDERSRENFQDWFISKSPAEPVSTIDFAALMREHLNQPAAAPKSKRIGRNDPCPCGSNKTYKKCCLKKFLRR